MLYNLSLLVAGAALISPVVATQPNTRHGRPDKRSKEHRNLAALKNGPKISKRETFSGRFTYYDSSVGLGSCGNYNGPDSMTFALNSAQLNAAGGGYPNSLCGKTALITYGGVTVSARVQDECPTCDWGSLDLTQGLFEKFGSTDLGVLQGSWVWADDAPAPPAETTTSSTYVAPTSTYVAPTSTYVAPTSTYDAPTSTWEAPAASAAVTVNANFNSAESSSTYAEPTSTYVEPSSTYVAPTSTYVAPTTTYESWSAAPSATASSSETGLNATALCGAFDEIALLNNNTVLYDGTTEDFLNSTAGPLKNTTGLGNQTNVSIYDATTDICYNATIYPLLSFPGFTVVASDFLASNNATSHNGTFASAANVTSAFNHTSAFVVNKVSSKLADFVLAVSNTTLPTISNETIVANGTEVVEYGMIDLLRALVQNLVDTELAAYEDLPDCEE